MTGPIEPTSEELIAKSSTVEGSTSPTLVPEGANSGKKRDPLLGSLLVNRYELLSLLGRGATTSVYKARDRDRDRFVAVKILRTDSLFNEQLIRRFEQECKTLALLKHSNIVELYDSGVNESDQPYLVMEYVDGISLKELIEADDRIAVKRTLRIFIQICAALAAAHEKGIVHRDMKPANIMLTKNADGEESVKILDFGVAKLLVQGETFQTKTQTGEMLGTLLYMSPEQCLEQILDERCDVYSVGCVLYETLTGKPPLIGRTAFETMNKHLTLMPEKLTKVRPDKKFDKRLDPLLLRAMAKDPKDRYQSIGALQSALSVILDSDAAAESKGDEQVLLPRVPVTAPEVQEKADAKLAARNDDDLPPSPSVNYSSFEYCNFLILLFGLGAFLLFQNIVIVIVLCVLAGFLNLNFNLRQTEPVTERKRIKEEPATFDDSSREGTVYFLAMEACDAVDWKNIYATQMSQYNISERDVLEQKRRLIAAQHETWSAVKEYVMASFNKLDKDGDDYISRAELNEARSHSKPHSREYEFLSFLLTNLEDIQSVFQGGETSDKGVRRHDLSEYFLSLEQADKETLSSLFD